MHTAEILSQGDEVVTGQIADTNAAWLADRLTELGFEVTRHTTVGDRFDDIRDVMVEISQRADVCIGTGGLGPTDDDYTFRAVAAAFGRTLEFNADVMAQIEAMFARYKRHMPDSNRRQAMLPSGADVLDNAWGTAPGIAVSGGRCWFAFVPGVPREMKPMFEQRILPRLQERFSLTPGRLVTVRTTGIGESEMQQRVHGFSHPKVVVGTRTMLPENHLKLRIAGDVPDDEVRAIAADVMARIGAPAFGVEGLGQPCGPLHEVVGRALLDRGATLATAESCTGGRVASWCTGIPGSSRWFLEGAVTYSNASKIRQLGVPAELIAEHGAVSEPVARAMAEGMRERSGATFALAITGIAGPDGGTPDKPVGTVHIALSGPGLRSPDGSLRAPAAPPLAGAPEGTHHRLISLGGDRPRIQDLAAATALDTLRRLLQSLPV